jgi:SAM-dependent methyltransferase
MEPTDLNRRVWDEAHRPVERQLPGLPRAVEERLPDVTGKHVLHLGCGTGEATAELAGLGALVTGVDASAEAVAAARRRAPAVAFVQGAPDQLPVELRRARFDLVYTPIGGELEPWATGVAAALRRGGGLLLHDAHPVLDCLDDMLHWRDDYFAAGRRRVGEVVTAIASVGLVVESLEELPAERPLLPQARRAPGELLLLARKP